LQETWHALPLDSHVDQIQKPMTCILTSQLPVLNWSASMQLCVLDLLQRSHLQQQQQQWRQHSYHYFQTGATASRNPGHVFIVKSAMRTVCTLCKWNIFCNTCLYKSTICSVHLSFATKINAKCLTALLDNRKTVHEKVYWTDKKKQKSLFITDETNQYWNLNNKIVRIYHIILQMTARLPSCLRLGIKWTRISR